MIAVPPRTVRGTIAAIRRTRFQSGEARISAALLALGAAVRIGWALHRPESGAAGEAMNVARAIGSGLGFADAYRPGQGPTAHLLPVAPGIGGVVYRLFGVQTPLAEAILASWSICLCLGSYLILFQVFRLLGSPPFARLGALATGCISPTYLGSEAVDFRVWEGGLTVFLSATLLWLFVRVDLGRQPSPRFLIATSLLLALAFFVHPLMGASLFVCAALVAARRFSLRQVLCCLLVFSVALSVMIGLWASRNARELGSPILLRSNAGLELSIGMYEGALNVADRRQAFIDRLRAVHPMQDEEAYRKMIAAGGEVAYSHALGEEAKGWIKHHPGQAARLMLRHLRQTLAPEAWQFGVFGSGSLTRLRAATASFAGVLGCFGMLLALGRARPGWAFPVIVTALLSLLSAPFQPAVRYTFLLYPLCLYAAWDLMAAITRDAIQHRADASREG